MKKLAVLFLFVVIALPMTAQRGSHSESIESGITLKMESEVQENGETKFFLDFRTNDVYECANYKIENDVKQEGNKLQVRLRGVVYKDPCADGMGPATSRLDLTSLQAGEYKVRVSINRQIFKAVLLVSESFYDLQIANEDPTLLRIYNGRLNRMPAHSIWGICYYADPYDKPVAEKFMKDLQAIGAAKTKLATGNYGDFYLHNQGETEEKTISREQYEYPFVYHYEGEMQAVQELVNRYQGKVGITLKSSEGTILRVE